MAEHKSYNMLALSGLDIDDAEVAAEFREIGYNVPDTLLYTPEFPEYLINQVYEDNKTNLVSEVNSRTGLRYTPEEAEKSASEHRKAAMMELTALRKK